MGIKDYHAPDEMKELKDNFKQKIYWNGNVKLKIFKKFTKDLVIKIKLIKRLKR